MEQSSTCMLPVSHLVKQLSSFYGTRRFITTFTIPPTCTYPEPAHTVLAPSSHFLKIHLSAILPPTPRSSKWSFSLTFSHQSPVSTPPLPHTCYIPHHFIPLDLMNRTIFGEEYRSLNSSLYSLPCSPVTLSLLSSNILLSTPFPNTLSLSSTLNLSDHISRPYKTRKVIFLYILIFIFLSSKLEDKRFCTAW